MVLQGSFCFAEFVSAVLHPIDNLMEDYNVLQREEDFDLRNASEAEKSEKVKSLLPELFLSLKEHKSGILFLDLIKQALESLSRDKKLSDLMSVDEAKIALATLSHCEKKGENGYDGAKLLEIKRFYLFEASSWGN